MSRSHLIVDVEQGLQFQILDAPGTILDPGHLSWSLAAAVSTTTCGTLAPKILNHEISWQPYFSPKFFLRTVSVLKKLWRTQQSCVCIKSCTIGEGIGDCIAINCQRCHVQQGIATQKWDLLKAAAKWSHVKNWIEIQNDAEEPRRSCKTVEMDSPQARRCLAKSLLLVLEQFEEVRCRCVQQSNVK